MRVLFGVPITVYIVASLWALLYDHRWHPRSLRPCRPCRCPGNSPRPRRAIFICCCHRSTISNKKRTREGRYIHMI
ncbi:hypothetical protein C8Q72DRAFT_16792 [Fomitopsis betulina]|nr:hypothetical protein C8Q72DRAFT_16792 [Fomitopsis betulina]